MGKMRFRVRNTWDGITQDDHYTYVHFGVGDYDSREHFTVLSLTIQHGETVAKVGVSTVLPTRNWQDYAYAYERAAGFVRLNKLED